MITDVSIGTQRLLELAISGLKVDHGPNNRGEFVCWCPFHPDGQGEPPHRPNLHVSEKGFKCHACGKGGSLEQLCKELGLSIPSDVSSLEQEYSYYDSTGQLLYQVVRSPGKRFKHRRPDGSGGWIWNMHGVERVLYRLQGLRSSQDGRIFIVEGEKDADRLARLDLTATTNSGGAGKWLECYNAEFQDRDVVILPDNDDAGRKHADKVAGSLKGVAASVKILELPGLEEKEDVSDWLDAGHTTAELLELVNSSCAIEPSSPQSHEPLIMPAANGSQADRLVQMVLTSGAELFHDPFGEPYARIPIKQHFEIHRIKGKHFKTWLFQLLWEGEGKVPSGEAVRSATEFLSARAIFGSPEFYLHNRVARFEGDIWVDLSDSDRRAVKISPRGWEIVSPPILFRRYAHQKPQVTPERGGDLHSLLGFLNVMSRSQQLLFLVHLVSCFIPDIPHPIFLPHGPQGSGKSSFLRTVRAITDPSLTPLLSLPKGAKQMVQQLEHHWTPMYDNLSSISKEQSDLLCRAVTGEGSSTRMLWTDDEDLIRTYRRCISINGINIVAEQPDLLDRSILYGLDRIGDKDRRTETDLLQRFERVKPEVLGAVFDAVARAQAIYPSIGKESLPLPRMADFALWGCAIAEALGHEKQEFLDAYNRNIQAQHLEALHSDPVGAVLLDFMELREFWKGSPTELFIQLDEIARSQRISTSSHGWPKRPHALSRRLNNLATNLKAVGYNVIIGSRISETRYIVIERVPVDTRSNLEGEMGSLHLTEILLEGDQRSKSEEVTTRKKHTDPQTCSSVTQMPQMTLFSGYEGRKHRDPS